MTSDRVWSHRLGLPGVEYAICCDLAAEDDEHWLIDTNVGLWTVPKSSDAVVFEPAVEPATWTTTVLGRAGREAMKKSATRKANGWEPPSTIVAVLKDTTKPKQNEKKRPTRGAVDPVTGLKAKSKAQWPLTDEERAAKRRAAGQAAVATRRANRAAQQLAI